MEEDIRFYLLTIRKDGNLFANVYGDKDSLKDAISLYQPHFPLRLFMLSKTFGSGYDLAVAEKDGSLVVCLGPKEDIPDSVKNIVKCKKKELDIESFLSVV